MGSDILADLALDAWSLLEAAAAVDPAIRLTQPSAPVLYFGDVDAYRASPLRVVTVGVNPSGAEFPSGSPWSRFACREIAESNGDLRDHVPEYLAALNSYFRHDPYNKWFKRSYEPVLNGIGASFYGEAEITAVHTDVCSPLPTSPTWRLLDAREQHFLAADGVPLWHRLVEELRPDVILASIRREHLARISLPLTSEPHVIYTVEQKRPCRIVRRRVRCGEGAPMLVSGAAATTPFQMLKDEDKRRVGAVVRNLVDG